VARAAILQPNAPGAPNMVAKWSRAR
jgi:hypothetical protein